MLSFTSERYKITTLTKSEPQKGYQCSGRSNKIIHVGTCTYITREKPTDIDEEILMIMQFCGFVFRFLKGLHYPERRTNEYMNGETKIFLSSFLVSYSLVPLAIPCWGEMGPKIFIPPNYSYDDDK